MYSFLMYSGITLIVGATLKMCHLINTCDITLKKDKEESKVELLMLPAPKEIIEQPITFKNTNDNPELEKKYADLILKNSLLEQKIKQREAEDKKIEEEVKTTLKGQGKYSKLAEDIFKG